MIRPRQQGPVTTRTLAITAGVVVTGVTIGALGVGIMAAQGATLGTPVVPASVAAAENVAWAAPTTPPGPVPGPSVVAVIPQAKPPKPPKPVEFSVVSVTPEGGRTYGVAIPIIVDFDQPIPKKARGDIQAAAEVSTSVPLRKAMWSWLDDDTMAFRPKQFWPEDNKVVVKLDFKGVEMATVKVDGKKRPFVGTDDEKVKFKIGRNQVTRVNLGTQTGKVFRDGKKVLVFPVSTGKPGWKTRTGIKAITDKQYNKVFTGDAFNEDYRLVARYALRLTPSGEFLHSATWAYGRLGVYAGSHGCTNMTDSDAGWFFKTAQYADPAIYFGDKYAPKMETYNGLGGPWNIPWKQWKKNSAKEPVPDVPDSAPDPNLPATPTPTPTTGTPQPATSGTDVTSVTSATPGASG